MSAMTRRDAILASLMGVGAIGLRALATGIPAALLASPARALATGGEVALPKYVIVTESSSGDPLNANVPGTYDYPTITHPTGAAFASTPIVQNGVTRTGAALWNTLPSAMLDQLAFFHNATLTPIHSDHGTVLRLNGAVANSEMLISAIAQSTGPKLLTTQPEPICIGAITPGGNPVSSEGLSYRGRDLPIIAPTSFASLLSLPNGPLYNLRSLRDQTLDQLNAWVKARGVTRQSNFIDRYALSQQQLRSMNENLLNNLTKITDDSAESQITVAVTLLSMNLAPAVAIKIYFGTDNHYDDTTGVVGGDGMQVENIYHGTGVAAIISLFQQLQNANLQDRVVFTSENVFGRKLIGNGQGRDHSAEHHVSLLMGSTIQGGVIGGLVPSAQDFNASPIDSRTGVANPAGDIPYTDTLTSWGKTLAAAVGLDTATINQMITGGTVVTAALK